MKEAFFKSPGAMIGASLLFLLFILGLYAPFFASSVPIFAYYNGKFYFPIFRYLLFKGFYTKEIDLFFNSLIFTFPLFLIIFFLRKKLKSGFSVALFFVLCIQFALFSLSLINVVKDPLSNFHLKKLRDEEIAKKRSYDPLIGELAFLPSFEFEEKYFSNYERVSTLYQYKLKKKFDARLQSFREKFEKEYLRCAPTLFSLSNERDKETILRAKKRLLEIEPKVIQAKASLKPLQKASFAFLKSEERSLIEILNEDRKLNHEINFIEDKAKWLEKESGQLFALYPLFRPYHWEEDAGGSELFNRILPFQEVTRPNRKDLFSSLIFGIRISLVVGVMASVVALLIGIPFGLITGYFGGKCDLFLFRLIEVTESMPSFFMLLLIIAITHVKSIFLVIGALALFGWTSFARYIRAETLREREKAYVLASRAIGFKAPKILFSDILPNACFPVLALLPFAMMSAISAEAALSFLGLGEENSASLGVLMSEARAYFPGESYLLWPPAIIISILLICFALMGDGLRKSLDPRTR